MKVLLVSDAGSIHTERWAAALKDAGVDVVLFSITPVPDGFYEEKTIKVYFFDPFRRGFLKHLSALDNKNPLFPACLRLLIQKGNIFHLLITAACDHFLLLRNLCQILIFSHHYQKLSGLQRLARIHIHLNLVLPF